MMSNKIRIEIGFDETILPTLNDELKAFVNCREKLLETRSNLWNDLISKIRNAFTTKGVILNNQREYKLLLGYISEAYPKIPLDVFNRKIRKAFGNYRFRGGDRKSNEESDSGAQELSILRSDCNGVGKNLAEVSNLTRSSGSTGSKNKEEPDILNSSHDFDECISVEILEADTKEEDCFLCNEDNSNQRIVTEEILIDFESSNLQASHLTAFSETGFLDKVLKRTARCIPTIRTDFITEHDKLQKEFIASQEITSEFLTAFRDLYDHRTVLLLICPVYVLTSQYHCLNLASVLACEIETLYSHLELMQLYQNADAFYQGVLKLYHPKTGVQALVNVFKNITEGESFIRVFEKESDYRRFSPVLTDDKKFLSIFEVNGETKAVRILAFGLKVSCISVSQGLVFIILIHHVFQRPFSNIFLNEFRVLESFLFGNFLETLMLKYSVCSQILESFGDLETFGTSSTVNMDGVLDISLL
ncbi:unnamed protein product [Allacma fusca]|uniref:Uncharacterized protein n=1 Tax=Allacma fusca TaxID=39272 RepID=A0A8J2NRK6_9HEXA|nr:unnamed protein product [Allacma fusca]